MTVNELIQMIREKAEVAGEFAARAAASAKEKAGKAYNTSKQQITIFTLKNDIFDLYKEIGSLVYDTHTTGGDNEALIEEKLSLIDEKRVKIEELRDIIDEINDAKTCDVCATRSDKDAEFCKKCGNKL